MEINFVEVLINIALSTFGGLVRRMSERERKPEQSVTLGYYMVGSFVSTFTGIVVYFLCKHFGVSQFLIAGLTALAGYIGSPALDLLSEIVKKRIRS